MLKVYADFRRFYVNIHELSKKKRKFDSLVLKRFKLSLLVLLALTW